MAFQDVMVQLFTLGTTDLRGGEELSAHALLSGSKRLALLAYLALARPRGFQRRDRLVGLFWPDSDQKRARGALRGLLHQVRRCLGRDVIVNRGVEEIGLAEHALWCDAIEFELGLDEQRLRDALELYRGDLLDGLYVPDMAPAFEQWLDGERARLKRRASQGAWALAEEEEALGNAGGATYWARRAASLAPLDESAVRRLMDLLSRTGDRAGALQCYIAFAGRLRDEIGVGPSAEMLRAAQLLRSDVGHGAPSDPEAGATGIPAMPADPRTIAVLPFADTGSEAETTYFGDGITEELIHHLAKVRDLRVAARTSSFAFRGGTADIREIGRKLGVAHVLEGSVRKAGDRLRITAQLIEVGTGYHLWSETYQRELRDVFGIQDEISRDIVAALQAELTGPMGRSAGPESRSGVEAYDLCLRGRYFLNKRGEAEVRKAIEYFEEALALNRRSARAHAGLADCYLVLSSATFGRLDPRPALARARACAEEALALDDTLTDAHVSLAIVRMRMWDWSDARARLRRAVEADPGHAGAHERYGWILALLGEFTGGLAALRRAEDLDPLSLPIKTAIGRTFHFMRRPDDAIVQYRRTLDLDPNYVGAQIGLGLTLLYRERHPEAVACFQRARELTGDALNTTAMLAYGYAASGQHEQAEALLGELRDRPKREHLSPGHFAWIHLGLGELDRAVSFFEEEGAAHGPASTLGVEPLLDPIRPDPRFQQLLKKIGLVADRSSESKVSRRP